MRYKFSLVVFNSKLDRNGNTYWAFRFIDHESGVVVEGMADGGRGAAEQIRYDFEGDKTGWCAKFLVHYKELQSREFDRMTKNWSYQLCNKEAIHAAIEKAIQTI